MVSSHKGINSDGRSVSDWRFVYGVGPYHGVHGSWLRKPLRPKWQLMGTKSELEASTDGCGVFLLVDARQRLLLLLGEHLGRVLLHGVCHVLRARFTVPRAELR